MATRDTVGCGFVTSGLVFGASHKHSAASDILTTSLVALTLDKREWPTLMQRREVKEVWFKSNVVITISQGSTNENAGLITFAANEWHVLPCEMNLATSTYFGIKGANATNTTEYFIVLGE